MAKAAGLILTCVALSGCKLFGGEREVPVTDLRPFATISAVCEDTPETRKQIRAHNSVYDSLKTKKKVVYRDDCPKEKPTS